MDKYPTDERHKYRPIVAAFTATADSYVFNDAVNALGINLEPTDCIGTISRKWEFSKSSGKHNVFLYEKEAEQFRRVCSFLLGHPDKKCLVFCRTKEQMNAIYDLLAAKLKRQRINTSVVQKYYGGVSNEEVEEIKRYICEMLVEGKVKHVIATSAFGMGVDIRDIRYVIHVGFPYNMLDYIQQCGRGGRDGKGCEYKLYASLEDMEKTANMLLTKYLNMYPMSKCLKIRQRDRKEYIKTVEYCLENTYHKVNKLKIPFQSKLNEYRDRDICEEYHLQHHSFQMLINASAETKRRIRRKEITFYESVLADGIYSLWYNGFESFTPRRLIACITGNTDLSFHKEKSKRVVELIDGLMDKGLVPIEKHTENKKTKYYFTEQAKKCIPGTFRLHETALQKKRMCNIPDGVLRAMSDSADSQIRKKKLDEYEDITIVKYYLLRELERIFGYSHFYGIASIANSSESRSYAYRSIPEATSSKMIYSRYDRNARANYGRVTTNAEKQTGHIRLDNLTAREIQKFINSLAQDGVNENTGKALSHKTMVHYLSFISTIIDYAIKMDMLTDNPCRRVTVPKGSKKDRRILTIEQTEEFIRLLNEAPQKYRVFFMLDIYSGMRRGELLGLEWKDIDFDEGVIRIQRTSNYTKSRGIYTDTTKTEGSERWIKVPEEIVELLKTYKTVQDIDRKNLANQWIDTDRLFTQWNGWPMSPQTPYDWLRKFCKKHNFPFYGVHQFRHLHTSLLIGAGVDPTTVSGILGHSQVSTTMNLYSHMFKENQVKACDAVANSISLTKKNENS